MKLAEICEKKNIRLTSQRAVIVKAIEDAKDHPTVEELYTRVSKVDKAIGLATVYRTVKLLKENNVIEEHNFGDGSARYEAVTEQHHDHMIDVRSGKVIEFYNEEIEELQKKIAEEHGYILVDHRLELYCVPKK